MTKLKTHSVRIVGGQWRGRRLPVMDQAALRPTKDLIRETIFNWLQPLLPGSRCLDAFAGSGVLGFEAASRDAAEVVLLEPQIKIYQSLLKQKEIFQASHIHVLASRAERYLQRPSKPFDIVFLDPPFALGVLSDVCALLAENAWLQAGGHIYLEAARNEGLPSLPESWSLEREKTSGDVVYGLAIVR